MRVNDTEYIKVEILRILNKYSVDKNINYNIGIKELEEYIVTLKDRFSKQEILEFLNSIFIEINDDENIDEILGDIVNRIHGYCTPNAPLVNVCRQNKKKLRSSMFANIDAIHVSREAIESWRKRCL